uniref:hypothetical protein n=1 Tax=Candidatus Limisoma sp. TaxID=3076476 RepID=UPI003FEF80BC
MEKELIKEIPCLPLDKLMSIFKPDKDDVYRHGLLIGRRSAVGGEHADISFVHPFSVNAFILICCDRGEVSISTNSEEFDLKPGTLYINFPGQIMRASRVDNCAVQVAVIDLNLIRDMSLDVKPMAQKLLALKYAQCMQLEPEAFKETECLIDSIADEIRNNEEDALSNDILRCLISALFFKVGRAVDKNTGETKKLDQEAFSKNAGYFKEFMLLLGANYKKERSVGFYAEQMHLSPKYFTTLIKKASGQTAADWITHNLNHEAKK